MERLKRFIRTTILGGVIVILPVLLTFFFLRWLFRLVTGLIEPLTRIVMEQSRLQEYIADFLVILIIVLICFIVGLMVKTRFGRYMLDTLEERILDIAPGYTLFKETIKQFLGKEKKPFSSVALVRVFGDSAQTLMTGFVTDRHPDGLITVFIPSALNPTTGLIYHLEEKYVHILDVSVEDTMRSIISCGVGSQKLVENFLKKNKKV